MRTILCRCASLTLLVLLLLVNHCSVCFRCVFIPVLVVLVDGTPEATFPLLGVSAFLLAFAASRQLQRRLSASLSDHAAHTLLALWLISVPEI
jgi:hypothetical protein